ncbi:PREDICTED: phospholipase A1-like [Dufourea novaeangliae]|uniref:phospholipase A1-like n=1 Tax=Dufourea novaeangliae TaxID=178035 RepID=UPI0007677E8C|nr:PREDICTED: phospholipase A1-like [Dufourea novaeangliae]
MVAISYSSRHIQGGFSLAAKIENVLKDTENGAPKIGDTLENAVGLTKTKAEREQNVQNLVQFYLYTRNTMQDPEHLVPNNFFLLKKSHFDTKKPTKIVTHGWRDSAQSRAVVVIRDAFIQNGDYNVITVDWSPIAKTEYIIASNDVEMVAKYTATLIDFLHKQGMDLSKLTTVGHSLGAHVAALAARFAQGTVNYVAALDPAQPNFLTKGPNNRVSRGDGKYVMVIHSNGGFLGFITTLGDSDFYPNGGSVQPGCVLDPSVTCSHARAYEYFAESINTKVGFWAEKCSNYLDFTTGQCKSNAKALMGGVNPNYNVKGSYYLTTNDKAPYAKGPL